MPALETLVGAARRRDELEAQVIETKALRRSNVVKTTLLRTVSHDLRSPLTAITAAAGGLARTRSGCARKRADLGDRDRERASLAAGGQPARPLAPSGGERRAAARLVRRRRGGATRRSSRCPLPAGGFDVELDPDLPLVRADAAQLERALANVLENSSRFAGDEPVTIRGARRRQVRDPAGHRSRSGYRRVTSWSASSSRSTARATATARRLGARPGDRARLRGGERRPDPGGVAAGAGHELRDSAAGPGRGAAAAEPAQVMSDRPGARLRRRAADPPRAQGDPRATPASR